MLKAEKKKKKEKSQTELDPNIQINHITESRGITGRLFVVFASNSLHVVYPFVLLCLSEFLILCCTCTNKNKPVVR